MGERGRSCVGSMQEVSWGSWALGTSGGIVGGGLVGEHGQMCWVNTEGLVGKLGIGCLQRCC